MERRDAGARLATRAPAEESLAAAASEEARTPNDLLGQIPAVEYLDRAGPLQRHIAMRLRAAWRRVPVVVVLLAALSWAAVFAYLSLLRHASGGTNAQDLGFTDQVIWNSVHGQWFRMSLYVGAQAWDTEMAIASVAQPESLLAFHFEPMLLLLTPIYALGGDARHLLVLQSIAFALGALPAYRLGARWGGFRWVGVAVAAAYLLSPLGQTAMLADFHTTALAAPLLVLTLERVAANRLLQAILAAGVAVTAREDAAVAVAALGLLAWLAGWRRSGLALLATGAAGAIISFLIIGWQSSGGWAFGPRYADLATGPGAVAAVLGRGEVVQFAAAVLLSGGLLGILAPASVPPLLALAALNALSSSAWMAAGRAHYSVLVLPFAVIGGALAIRHLAGLRAPQPSRAVTAGAAGLVVGAVAAHLWAGVGPLGGHFAPSAITDHAQIAAAMAQRIPAEASVSASSSLVPRVSRRADLNLFPTIGTADYVFVDVAGNAAPTSPGDTYLRLQGLLSEGGWHVDGADDGLLLLARRPGTPPLKPRDLPRGFFSFIRDAPPATKAMTDAAFSLRPLPAAAQGTETATRFSNVNLELVGGEVAPAVDDTLGVDGVRGILRTTWRATGPVPSGAWVEIDARLVGDREARFSDLAANWWYPPDQWTPNERVHLDVPVSLGGLIGWSARVRTPEPG